MKIHQTRHPMFGPAEFYIEVKGDDMIADEPIEPKKIDYAKVLHEIKIDLSVDLEPFKRQCFINAYVMRYIHNYNRAFASRTPHWIPLDGNSATACIARIEAETMWDMGRVVWVKGI